MHLFYLLIYNLDFFISCHTVSQMSSAEIYSFCLYLENVLANFHSEFAKILQSKKQSTHKQKASGGPVPTGMVPMAKDDFENDSLFAPPTQKGSSKAKKMKKLKR